LKGMRSTCSASCLILRGWQYTRQQSRQIQVSNLGLGSAGWHSSLPPQFGHLTDRLCIRGRTTPSAGP